MALTTFNSPGGFSVGFNTQTTIINSDGNISGGNVSGTTGAFTNVSGNGSALTALNAGNITTGTLAVTRGGTGITSLGAGVATFLGTPSSTNLAAAVTDETGSGSLVFGTSPLISSPELTTAPYVNGSYRSNIVSVAALDIDCSLGNYFVKTIEVQSTFTFSNVPTSRAYSFTLEVIQNGGIGIIWPVSVTWPNNTAPTLTTSRTHLFMFVTDDGGTRWRGSSLINYTT